MKRLIIPLILLLIFCCGCSEAVSDTAGEELLRTVVEKIDFDQLMAYAEKGVDAVVEKFSALKPLTSREDMQELLKDKGLDLIGEYLESTDEATQANAEKLGAIIKILSPDLSDEVDAVLAE